MKMNEKGHLDGFIALFIVFLVMMGIFSYMYLHEKIEKLESLERHPTSESITEEGTEELEPSTESIVVEESRPTAIEAGAEAETEGIELTETEPAAEESEEETDIFTLTLTWKKGAKSESQESETIENVSFIELNEGRLILTFKDANEGFEHYKDISLQDILSYEVTGRKRVQRY